MRGIFAIEGEWFTDLRGGVSFKPLLDIIKVLHNSPYVHRDAATRQELFYYLQNGRKNATPLTRSCIWVSTEKPRKFRLGMDGGKTVTSLWTISWKTSKGCVQGE